MPVLTGSKLGWILAWSTELAVGRITPDDVTLVDGAMHGVSAALAFAKFMLLAPASHVDGEQVDHNRAGMIGIDDSESLVRGPVWFKSISNCVGLRTLTPLIGARPPLVPTDTPLALNAM
jgi:hypothetical protein